MKTKITVVIVTIIFILFSCNRRKKSITSEVKNISESVYESGIVLSSNQYEVHPKVNGIVYEILIKESDFVKKNDLLFRIENPNANITVDNVRLNSAINEYDAKRMSPI